MDIRNWSIGQIMQLPDCCFGRRWPIGLAVDFTIESTMWEISGAALPERCVIWEVYADITGTFGISADFGLALGDVLPTDDTQFAELEILFPGWFSIASGRGHVELGNPGYHVIRKIRMPVAAAGRRIVLRGTRVLGLPEHLQVILIVSSFPTEVSDCLLSV